VALVVFVVLEHVFALGEMVVGSQQQTVAGRTPRGGAASCYGCGCDWFQRPPIPRGAGAAGPVSAWIGNSTRHRIGGRRHGWSKRGSGSGRGEKAPQPGAVKPAVGASAR
jgi:hypothetical protein